VKRGRQDAHDFVGNAVESEGRPDGRGIGVEAVAPEGVGQDEDAAAAFLVFRGKERAAEGGPGAEHGEEVRRSAHAEEDLRFAETGEIGPGRLGDGHVGERVDLLLPDAEIWEIGVEDRRGLRELRHDLVHEVELSRVGIGERPEQGAVHDREDGRVGADAESERENGDGGESGALAQTT
jgi:hypothetical protein